MGLATRVRGAAQGTLLIIREESPQETKEMENTAVGGAYKNE